MTQTLEIGRGLGLAEELGPAFSLASPAACELPSLTTGLFPGAPIRHSQNPEVPCLSGQTGPKFGTSPKCGLKRTHSGPGTVLKRCRR